jgi:ABC-2 type transport system permease protein
MGMKIRSGHYIKFLAYLIIVVLINVAGTTLFFRADLTDNKIYSISEASRRVVSALFEPLTINVFFTRNLPVPHNNTERYIHDLLEEYAVYANRYFNYRFFDVSPEEGNITQKTRENQELARNYGIYPVQIRVIQKDEVKFQKAYMGLVLIHGDLVERIPTITSTEGLEYKLTTTIQKLNNKISTLLSLPEKIKIKLFLSSSLNVVAPHMRLRDLSKLPGKVEGIVKNLNGKNYGKLEFEHLDPSTDQALEEVVKKYHLLNLKWPALSGGKIKSGKGAIGLVMEYHDRAIEIPLLHVKRLPLIGTHYELVNMKKMDEAIDEAIETLIDINEDLGYLADHGTLKLPDVSSFDQMKQEGKDTISTFSTLISQNYTIKNVNLKEGDIPDSINCLVIAGPTEAFSEYELFQIDQFLMRGRSLALFLDPFHKVIPPAQKGRPPTGAQYVPVTTGLEKLLEHYGIRIKKSYVMDENCYKQALPARFGGGVRPIYFVPVIKNEFIDKELEFMRNIKGLITMRISPLEINIDRVRKNLLHSSRLFASSEKSWEMSGRINLNHLLIRPPEAADTQQSFPLAYILKGQFPSYFAGKPIPEKKTADERPEKTDEENSEGKEADVDLSQIVMDSTLLSKGKPGRIFLMASAEMLKDNMLDEEGKSPNTMFIMNVVDFLNNREGIAVLRSKEQRFNPLVETKAGIKTFVKSFNIAGLPILVVLFGLLVWFYRHSRKRRIQMMFQK